VNPDGTTSFAAMQAATDTGSSGDLVFFAFDLLHLDGVDTGPLPVIERKAKLASLLKGAEMSALLLELALLGPPLLRRYPG
jgi:bifunctional non-homologous end joining protein LigD